MDVDYSSLSNQELSQMLKDYGVDVGPINVATRKIYERKLHKLKTGAAMTPARKYEPVANDEDDDDDEVQFKPPPVSQPRQQPPAPNVMDRKLSDFRESNRTPELPQPRLRRDPADIYSPHINSRPSLNSARKTTLSYDPKRPNLTSSTPSAKTDDQAESKGLPLWVKLTSMFVALLLIYLIYSNMESNAANNIPKIPGKVEV